MHFLLRSLSTSLRRTHHPHHYQNRRTFCEEATPIKWVRDRGLDHAVLREKNLKPVINLKNLIKSEPSKSVPLSIITASRESLELPVRPIEFIRKYRTIFEEYFPGNVAIHPHVKLTPEVINLDVEENLVYESVDYKQDLADRLLKLLMIGRINKIPLGVLDRIKWELGLPQDYARSIVPEFPDYFTVSKGNVAGSDEMLELVCWSNELAVSVIQKKAKKVEIGKGKVVGFEFPMKYTQGFEMDKKSKKWVDDWQKLPYLSPYENVTHLDLQGDDSDKWAVSVLHEILNLFVGKKAEKESVLFLGEFFGLRSKFKKAMLQLPGIFYVSSKNWTHTVVLRDSYKRGALAEKDILMDMRFKYARLMNTTTKVEDKSKGIKKKAGHKPKEGEGEELENDLSGEEDEEDDEVCELSNEDTEDEEEEEDDDDDEEDDDDENANCKGKLRTKPSYEKQRGSRNLLRSSAREVPRKTMDRSRQRFSRTDGDNDSANNRGKTRPSFNKRTYGNDESANNRGRTRPSFSKGTYGDDESANNRGRPRPSFSKRTYGNDENANNRGRTRPSFSNRTYGDDESANTRGRLSNKSTFEEKRSSRNSQDMDQTRPRFSRRTYGDDESANNRGSLRNKATFDEWKGSRNIRRSSGERYPRKSEDGTRPRSSRTDRDGQYAHGNSRERSEVVPRKRGRSNSSAST